MRLRVKLENGFGEVEAFAELSLFPEFCCLDFEHEGAILGLGIRLFKGGKSLCFFLKQCRAIRAEVHQGKVGFEQGIFANVGMRKVAGYLTVESVGAVKVASGDEGIACNGGHGFLGQAETIDFEFFKVGRARVAFDTDSIGGIRFGQGQKLVKV